MTEVRDVASILEDAISRLGNRSFGLDALHCLEQLLRDHGTFRFPTYETGLFPAGAVDPEYEYTKYDDVWVRDTVHIANAHFVAGEMPVAVKAAQALLEHFTKQRGRFGDIIDGKADHTIPANRPYIRFNGRTLAAPPTGWSHDQNDALGYFLWFFCKLIREGLVAPTDEALATLGLFPRFFAKIEYWQDQDSGHWEEDRGVSASSIGVVLGGLLEWRTIAKDLSASGHAEIASDLDLLDRLIDEGRNALESILPNECVSPPERVRQHDASLLFLIYPVGVVPASDPMADTIVTQVVTLLQGKWGISRYRDDSFWGPNYHKRLAQELRTADWSANTKERKAQVPVNLGEEAQWCIFDPIVSAIYGKKYQLDKNTEHLAAQMDYLKRSLNQLTRQGGRFPPLRCPELYYLVKQRMWYWLWLKEKRSWQPNDVTPLLWTQANLLIALKTMEESLKLRD